LPIHYDTFIELRWRIRGVYCLLLRPPMLNAKSSENFLSPDQNWANFGGFGGLGVMGFKKLRYLLLAWTHVVWAILRQNRSTDVTSRSVREKNPESHRDSRRKDMSPLTQGLNYRSACDSEFLPARRAVRLGSRPFVSAVTLKTHETERVKARQCSRILELLGAYGTRCDIGYCWIQPRYCCRFRRGTLQKNDAYWCGKHSKHQILPHRNRRQKTAGRAATVGKNAY